MWSFFRWEFFERHYEICKSRNKVKNCIRKVKALFFGLRNIPFNLRFFILKKAYEKKGFGNIFNIFTHLTNKEKFLLLKKTENLESKSNIIEIGSYLGASSCFFALGALKNNSKVYCIDTWKNEGMSEGEKDTFEEFCENIEPLKDFIRILRGKSVDMAKNFSEEIDLLFIDGDHSYDAVRADVEAWLPKVKNDGIVVFHDIGWAEGVIKVVNEFIRSLQVEEHIVDNTYWARIGKNEQNESFRDNSNPQQM